MGTQDGRESKIEYRVEIWATRRDGERFEAWSGVFEGEAWWPATVSALVRLAGKGWTAAPSVFRNGRSMDRVPLTAEQLVELNRPEILGLVGRDLGGLPAAAAEPEGLETLEPGDELSLEEHDELDRREDQGEEVEDDDQADQAGGELVPLRGIDGNEQRMLFR